MKVLLVFFVWCILLVLCWPIALAAILAAPIVLLAALPFRLLGLCISGVFALLGAIVALPARLLGCRCAG
jgi:hypothetical protein